MYLYRRGTASIGLGGFHCGATKETVITRGLWICCRETGHGMQPFNSASPGGFACTYTEGARRSLGWAASIVTQCKEPWPSRISGCQTRAGPVDQPWKTPRTVYRSRRCGISVRCKRRLFEIGLVPPSKIIAEVVWRLDHFSGKDQKSDKGGSRDKVVDRLYFIIHLNLRLS